MPELPEVETIRIQLEEMLVGRKILDISTESAKQVKPSLSEVNKAVIGTSIKAVKRRAKLLQIFLSNGKILAVHLKLTGRLLFRDKKVPTENWQRVTIGLSGDKELRLADLRKFAWIKLIDNEVELAGILSEFGAEPMDDLTLEKFVQVVSSSSRPIKVLLMDQKKISGVGNIYACDALNLAKIDPKRPSSSLSPSEEKILYEAVLKVLKAGIKYRGASDQFYLDALGERGSYQDHFLVYGRAGKECFNCKAKITKIKLAGRGTYYCSACQI